jgi:L-serine kinase (ADP)
MRELELVSLDRIQETEEHDSILAIQLAETIFELGLWTVPIAIEQSTYAVMDGHHRLYAAKLLNFKRVPCILMDYQQSGVVLRSWRKDFDISVTDIFMMIKNNKKYPLKTTRHLFNPSIQEISIPLSLLY